ncbi:MAG: T9SS type A sorting domain-containing protein [Bacteroidota bacterium]
MKGLLLLLLLGICTTRSNSQIRPIAFVEDNTILDVTLHNNSTFYAIGGNITQIDSSNAKTILHNTSLSYSEGRFYDTADGWVYLGWRYIDYDVILPNIIVHYWDGETLETKTISLHDQGYEEYLAVSYQSQDSIYILTRASFDYKMLRINDDGDLLESSLFEASELYDMKLLENNVNLVAGLSDLYTIQGDMINNQISFGSEVVDFKIYEDRQRIEVLTYEKILVLDYALNIQREFYMPFSDRIPQAIYTYGDTTFLIEDDANQSFITYFDFTGFVLEKFIERTGIRYRDLFVTEDIYTIWGRSGCSIGGNMLKTDHDRFQSEFSRANLTLHDLNTEYEKESVDTIILPNGDIVFNVMLDYTWSLTITNNGLFEVAGYNVSSDRMNEVGPPFIQFNSEDSLSPGESRIHEGKFSVFEDHYISTYAAWVGTNLNDSDCSDNYDYSSIPTNVTEDVSEKITIVPNPVSDQLSVNISVPYSFSIFDFHGNKYFSKKDVQSEIIDVTELPTGIYILDVILNEKRYRKRFIKM